ncbi:hypothetical protein AU074_27865 [Pseudomonas sp. ATCC PTA-122608]|nr:hypothetical protein AU074_27865 [Pseudomonas sp. ATCC PTA-122608]
MARELAPAGLRSGPKILGALRTPAGASSLEHHFDKPELAEVGNPRGVQPADQVIALVLDHSCVEAFGNPHNRLALGIEAFVANLLVTVHCPTQAGHRQAPFIAFFQHRAEWRDQRVDQDGLGHGGRVRVAFAALETEDHQLQVHTHLRRGQANATDVLHGLEHVINQLPQLRAVEHLRRNRRGNTQQALIAHFQDFTDHRSDFVGSGLE